MEGLIVAWSNEEIQAIDQETFQENVVTATEAIFQEVESPETVTVDWKTETRDHNVVYEVTQPPQLGYDSCYVDIRGGKGGEYRLELDSDELSIRQYSNDWVEELTYFEFRAPKLAADSQSNTISLPEIPQELKRLKSKAVRATPTIEW